MSSLPRVEEEGGDHALPTYTTDASLFSVSTSGRTMDSRPSITQNSSPHLAHQDEDILARTVKDCGLHAYGAIFVELWVLSTDGKRLRRPPGGHWMDPQFIHSVSPPSLAEQVNEHAQACAPGVSLAGTLYNEVSSLWQWGINRKVYWRQIKSMMDDPFVQDDGRLKSLHDDLGIGIVATIPFSYHGRNGIVLFMSRSSCNVDRLRSTANENFLIAAADLMGASFAIRIPRQEVANIRREMLRNAIRKLMKLIKTNKGKRLESIVSDMESEGMNPTKSFAHFMFITCSDDISDGAEVEEASHASSRGSERNRRPARTISAYASSSGLLLRDGWSTLSTVANRVSRRIVNSIRKWEGARLLGPARMSANDCVIIFIMVTLTMLTILRVNDALEDANPDNIHKWNLNGGWYASTVCIVFALSSAPVGQPRQIIAAHLINAIVGLAFQQIPTTPGIFHFSDFAKMEPGERAGLPLFWKESFAVGVGVAAQAWLGVIHPPATGLAFSYAQSDRYSLSNLVVVILADFILIALATLLLNLQKNKQYPLFWLGLTWKYPSGKTHHFANKTLETTAALSERIVRRRKSEAKMPQDHIITSTSTAADSSGVENL